IAPTHLTNASSCTDEFCTETSRAVQELERALPFHGRFSSKALLRETGGFEGVCEAFVDLGPDDLSIAKGEDVSEFEHGRRAAAHSPTALAGSKDHLVPMVDRLVDFDLKIVEGEGTEPILLEEHPDLVLAAKHAEARYPGSSGIKNDLSRQEPTADYRSSAAPAELLHGLPHDLHVLLRHRPRSIPRRAAAFHGKRDYCFWSKAAVSRDRQLRPLRRIPPALASAEVIWRAAKRDPGGSR